ncbi:hypothetical protein SLS54_006923 [Diplodia seriata]
MRYFTDSGKEFDELLALDKPADTSQNLFGQKILSTGLLVLEPTDTVAKGMILLNKAQFDFSHVLVRDQLESNYSTAGAVYNGIHSANLTYPDWTTSDFALEPLEPILSEAPPSYSTRSIQVSLDRSSRLKSTQVQPLSSEGTPESNNTSKLDPAVLFDAVMNASFSGVLTTPKSESAHRFLNLAALPLLQGVSNVQEPYLQWLMDTQTMIPQVEGAFKGIAVQFAAQDLMRSNSEQANGSILCSQDRLQVKEVPVMVMAVCLILGSLIALSMVYMRPWDVVPREPNSILGIAAILNSSEDFKALLTDPLPVDKKKIPREETIASVLKDGTHTYTVLVPGTSAADRRPDVPKHRSKEIAQWRPLPLQPWAKAGALLLTLLTICSLEVLQQMSDKHHGFAGIDLSNRESGRYAATFVPTLILVGIAALASALNFNITLLSPYRAMRDRPCPPGRCIQANDLGRWPLFQAFQSLRRRHFAACATSFASIIAGFLTIAVSGLYTLETVDKSTDVTLSRSDGFRTEWYGNIYSDGNAAAVLGFISWQNLSYPAWTYDDLAFPSVSVNNNDKSIHELGRSVSVVIPAQRAVLKCTLADPQKTIVMKNTTKPQIFNKDFAMQSEMTKTCTGNKSATPYYFDNYGELSPHDFGAAMSQLTYPLEGLPIAYPNDYLDGVPGPRPGCSSLAFYFGTFGPAPTYLPAAITAFTCTQHIQEYPVTYPLHSAFLPTRNGSTFAVPGLDAFYTAVVHGAHGVPAAELVGPANAPRLVDATEKLYGRYMAQVLSLKMRESLNVSDGAAFPQVQGVLTSQELSVVQNAGPKMALQAMLAVMAACGVAAWVLMRTTALLPHNPCSVAGVAALLVGGGVWADGGAGDDGLGVSRDGGGDQNAGRSREEGEEGEEEGLDRCRRRDADGAGAGDDASSAGVEVSSADTALGMHHGEEAENDLQPRYGTAGRSGIFPDGVEWMDDDEMARHGILDGKLFSLSRQSGGRFGIEVVGADSQKPA